MDAGRVLTSRLRFDNDDKEIPPGLTIGEMGFFVSGYNMDTYLVNHFSISIGTVVAWFSLAKVFYFVRYPFNRMVTSITMLVYLERYSFFNCWCHRM